MIDFCVLADTVFESFGSQTTMSASAPSTIAPLRG